MGGGKSQEGTRKRGRRRRSGKKNTTNLRVDVRVDSQQHPRDLPRGLGSRGDVGEVELRVHVDQGPALHRQPELPGELAVAVEDRALGVEARSQRHLELVARDQHAAGAQLLQMLQDAEVVVGLDGVADDGVDALERVPVGREVGRELRLRVEVERGGLGLGAHVVDLDRVAVEEAVLLSLVEASAFGGREDRGRARRGGGGRRGGAGAEGGGGAALVLEREGGGEKRRG